MLDAEYVLRFLTINDRFNLFSGNLSGEMDDFMRNHRLAGSTKIDKFADDLSEAIARCKGIWGDKAFRRPEGNTWRDQTLAGMFDAQMIAVSKISAQTFNRLSHKSSDVSSVTRRLFSDQQFEKAVRTGTNTPARINYRVNKMKEALESIR